MSLTIELTPEQERQLTAVAEKNGLSPREWVHRELAELITRQAGFLNAAGYVLKKNAELYERLAK